MNKIDTCYLCHLDKPLIQTKLQLYGEKKWEEKIIFACKQCMKDEELLEFKEKEEIKAA